MLAIYRISSAPTGFCHNAAKYSTSPGTNTGYQNSVLCKLNQYFVSGLPKGNVMCVNNAPRGQSGDWPNHTLRVLLFVIYILYFCNVFTNAFQLPHSMSHTILLVQPNPQPHTRTYSDYESVNECMEGVCKIYEEHLKRLNPNTPTITYDISQLFDFVDQVRYGSWIIFSGTRPTGRSLFMIHFIFCLYYILFLHYYKYIFIEL